MDLNAKRHMSVFGSSFLPLGFLYGGGTLLPASVTERVITRRTESTKKSTKGNTTTVNIRLDTTAYKNA